MTKPTDTLLDTLARLERIATTGRRPRRRRSPTRAPEVAAEEAEAFVARLDGDHEPGGLGLAIMQEATRRARRT